MNDAPTPPTKVHFVGSIGLDSVRDVFQEVGTMMGRRLRRIPDGEPGGRRLWTSWQWPALSANPNFKIDDRNPPIHNALPRLCLADGVNPDDVQLGELGYAREARPSYEDFVAAREAGAIAPGVRFQIALPTPYAIAINLISPPDRAAVQAIYERAIMREVAEMCRVIPHRDLCIQWDVCAEIVYWDFGNFSGAREPVSDADKERIIGDVKRLCDAVPADVELGIHLCYGDYGGKHGRDPDSARPEVDISNRLVAAVSRPINYIQMPIPLSHSDDAAFYAPYADLDLGATEIYLGLIHAADGVSGTKARIALASRYIQGFGISSECGIARARDNGVVHKFLETYAGASQEP